MYTEEFEEEEKGPRAYVSHFSQQDAEKLARENEKLKKSLEKEKFFNKLLDQELKEVKAEAAAKYPAEYQTRGGVSKGAFYSLLFLSLAMAGFIFYTLYNNKQYNLFNNNESAYTPAPVDQQSSAEETQDFSTNPEPAPPVKDSVPNIIGNTNNPVAEKKTEQVKKQQPIAAPKEEEEYNEAEVEAALQEPVNNTRTNTPKPATNTHAGNANTSTASTGTSTTTEQTVEEQQPPAPQEPSRPVIARYRVTSKANFYNDADENTLRSAFISAGPNKIVDALEDKNGFIYVEYVNDRGMMSKGWLSKKDLTKSE